MTSQRQGRGAVGILGRGIGLGATRGAATGGAISGAILTLLAVVLLQPLVLVLFPVYVVVAAVLGAVIGLVEGILVGVALILAGAPVRHDRRRTRILAGVVAAIPGVAVLCTLLVLSPWNPAAWLVAVLTLVAMVAAVRLAPRVALGKPKPLAYGYVVRI